MLSCNLHGVQHTETSLPPISRRLTEVLNMEKGGGKGQWSAWKVSRTHEPHLIGENDR